MNPQVFTIHALWLNFPHRDHLQKLQDTLVLIRLDYANGLYIRVVLILLCTFQRIQNAEANHPLYLCPWECITSAFIGPLQPETLHWRWCTPCTGPAKVKAPVYPSYDLLITRRTEPYVLNYNLSCPLPPLRITVLVKHSSLYKQQNYRTPSNFPAVFTLEMWRLRLSSLNHLYEVLTTF